MGLQDLNLGIQIVSFPKRYTSHRIDTEEKGKAGREMKKSEQVRYRTRLTEYELRVMINALNAVSLEQAGAEIK